MFVNENRNCCCNNDCEAEERKIDCEKKEELLQNIRCYEFAINGFQGTLNGFQTFEIEDTDEEQYYRLYPVTNDSGISYSRDLSLNTPYDEEEVNLDNILITILDCSLFLTSRLLLQVLDRNTSLFQTRGLLPPFWCISVSHFPE